MESPPLTAEAIAYTEKKMDMALEDIIKMSKKKNPGGKKPPRQPIKKHPFQNGNSNKGNGKVQSFMESRSTIRQGVLAQRRSNLGGNQFPATKQAAKKAAVMPMHKGAIRWNKPSHVFISINCYGQGRYMPEFELVLTTGSLAVFSVYLLNDECSVNLGASTLVQRRPVGGAFQNAKVKESNQAAPRTMDALFAQMKAQRLRTVPQQQANSSPWSHFNQHRRVQQQQRRGRGYGGRNVGNQ
ncbi:hypothetical protein ZEAMMB73_Zm00001d032350 [Zea mays]|uniref:Uncharacterized protein n=2 Tax=Zea mays TaxID=4577 RepID=A0A1D6KQ66_MAIZE|nr:hypothetical protein ZEAMMB73_Zm00001d032350 [Zea mays]ONM04911.1 hypothetical protein ZEAMMB73_Zm00001d032350 [Zea mays]